MKYAPRPQGMTLKLKERGITSGLDMCVLFELLTHWDRRSPDAEIFPSRKRLAELVGCDKRDVGRAFSSIRKSNLLIFKGYSDFMTPSWSVPKETQEMLNFNARTPYVKWTQGTGRFLREKGLSSGAEISVLYELLSHSRPKVDDEEEFYPSSIRIEKLTEYTNRTVLRAFSEIRKAGVLIQTGGGVGRSSIRWKMSDDLVEQLDYKASEEE